MTNLGVVDPPLESSSSLLRLVLKLGVPSAIACALVWFLMTTVSTKLDAHGKAIADQAVTLKALSDEQLMAEQAHTTLVSELQQQRRLLRLICYNGARDDAARDRCFEGEK